MNGEVYIFDLDGTLVDSMDGAVKVVLDYLTERGIAYPDDIVSTLTPLGFAGICKYYHEHFGIPKAPEEIYQDFQAGLTNLYAKEVPAKDGAERVLKTLQERGVRTFVLTGSPHAFLDVCIQRLGFTQYFENCWTAAEDFGYLKGDERLYKAVAERIGVPIEKCIMIDDGVKGLRKAHEAGMQTVGFYDSYSIADEQEMRSFADRYIYQFDELL